MKDPGTPRDTLIAFLRTTSLRYTRHPTIESLTVHGTLDLDFSGIEELPDDLTVQGSLESTQLIRLPERLRVYEDLRILGDKITALPENLFVGRDMQLTRSAITSLPKGLCVPGNLLLRYAPISVLPEGLDVAGDLDLRDTLVRRLPEDLRVGGTLHPSDMMDDIIAFMATQVNELILSLKGSHHHRMELRAVLRPFPDLARLLLSLPPDKILDLWKDEAGMCHARVQHIF